MQEFSDVIEFDNQEPFVRVTGLMESEYDRSWVYVGLIQLTGKDGDADREISGAAYGLGPVSMRDAWIGGARVKRGDALMSEWNMVLQRDVDNPNFEGRGRTASCSFRSRAEDSRAGSTTSIRLKQKAAAVVADVATTTGSRAKTVPA